MTRISSVEVASSVLLLEAYHKESRIGFGFEVAKNWGFIWVITVGHVVYIVHAQDSLKITEKELQTNKRTKKALWAGKPT